MSADTAVKAAEYSNGYSGGYGGRNSGGYSATVTAAAKAANPPKDEGHESVPLGHHTPCCGTEAL